MSPASEPKTAESGTFQQGQVGDVSRAPFTDPKQYTAGDQSQDPVIYTQTGKTNWAAVSRDLVYLKEKRKGNTLDPTSKSCTQSKPTY